MHTHTQKQNYLLSYLSVLSAEMSCHYHITEPFILYNKEHLTIEMPAYYIFLWHLLLYVLDFNLCARAHTHTKDEQWCFQHINIFSVYLFFVQRNVLSGKITLPGNLLNSLSSILFQFVRTRTFTISNRMVKGNNFFFHSKTSIFRNM